MFATLTTSRTKVLGALAAVAVATVAVGGCAGSAPAAEGPSSTTAAAAPAPASAAATGAGTGTGANARATVAGSVRIAYAYSPDDDIRFTFDVEAVPFTHPLPELAQGLPTDARGTVKVSHHVAALNRTVTSEATVDCLVTGDRTATFTAIITRADPEVADSIGARRGFSVYDGGSPEHPDRVGFSWGVANMDTDSTGKPVEGRAGTCMAPAPFAPVSSGDLTVHHADLPPMPAAPSPNPSQSPSPSKNQNQSPSPTPAVPAADRTDGRAGTGIRR
ncbi:hypothetical protein OH807_35360 [Kitasatospora sp. NBC_01560]|uniref:hypothetical protein n=1 Tax=Kitasatospora sp. NBC_01560 TaxID=2975965 RepID=UPI003866033B